MKKLLIPTLLLTIIIFSPVFASYSTIFSQSSDTVGWSAAWEGGPYGTITVGWGLGGYSGEDCLYVYVNKTSSSSANIDVYYSNPAFTLGTDTVLNMYVACTNSASSPNAQVYSQQGSGWTWANGSWLTLSNSWQSSILYRNDTGSGTPMDRIGLQILIGTNTGNYTFKIDNVIFGPSLSTTVPPLVITTSSLPNATINYSYSQVLQAANGTPPYTWTTTAGTLPPGLNFYSSGTISGTPTSLGIYNFTVRVTDSVASTATQALSITLTQITVNYTISPQLEQQAISPYIYGTNQTLVGGENFTLFRMGGNRLSAYNWVTNWSNAGNDWYFESDDGMLPGGVSVSIGTVSPCTTNTVYVLNTRSQFTAQNLLTIQMAGYVSADDTGDVSTTSFQSWRFNPIAFHKGSAFTTKPTETSYDDGATVYMDEQVNYLVNRFGTGGSSLSSFSTLSQVTGGIPFYDLDNEPSIWSGTHKEIHPTATCCTELVQKTIACSSAIKSVDSTALVFGPVEYGFEGYLTLQGAPDWASVSTGYSPNWFLSYYLDTVKQASVTFGERLLDVLDLHYYSSPTGSEGNSITGTTPTSDTLSDKQVRLQAPRTLWDKNYIEPSWIAQWNDQYLPLIPTIQTSINNYYPGTKNSFTEYSFGGGWDITGGIAQADALGIYGKYGVYAACYWSLGQGDKYTSLAYKMYRNYDGKNSTFGDTHVQALMDDTTDTSIYASVMSSNQELHIMVLNKNWTQSIQGNFTISSLYTFDTATVYSIVSTSGTSIIGPSVIPVTGNSFIYNLPPLSITHFILMPVNLNVPDWKKD